MKEEKNKKPKGECAVMPNLYDGSIEILARVKGDEDGKIISGTAINIRTLIEMMDNQHAPMGELQRTREKIRSSKEPKEIKDEREKSAINQFCQEIVQGSVDKLIGHVEEDVELSTSEKLRVAEAIGQLIEGSFRIYMLKKESGWYEKRKEEEKEEKQDFINRLSNQVGNA